MSHATPPLECFKKGPDETLDFGLDWSPWLDSAVTITASTWNVPSGITSGTELFSETATKIRLSGGTAGQEYLLENQITGSDGQKPQRTIAIIVRKR